MRDDVIAAIARATIYPYNKAKYRNYLAQLADSPRIERNNLMNLVQRHRNTDFGRAHHFAAINSVENYRAQVPISDYADLEPYFDAVARGETGALFPASERVLDFTCTTGTTGKPKVLPITRNWLDTYQRLWRIWGVKALMDHPGIMQKKWLQISGSARMGRTASGRNFGSISAITARYQNPLMKFGYAAPPEVGDITDSQTRNYALLRLAITHPVGFIITITAANLIGLAELADLNKQTLIRDLHDGTITGATNGQHLPDGRLRSLMRTRHPERARELERIVVTTGTLYPKDFWQLELVACWTGGTVGYQARNLAKYYGNTPVRDVGYISTEGRHTIPVDDFSPQGVLVAGGGFYEFVPSDGGDPRNGHELQEGKTYSVIMTGENGLYRYRLGDIVRCNGFQGPAPIIEFLCKTEQYADLEGEKISGDQIAHVITTCQERFGLEISSFSAIAIRPSTGLPYYGFVIEPIATMRGDLEHQMIELLELELGNQNFLYRYKRDDGSLAAARLLVVAPGSFAARTKMQTSRTGTGESQYKQPALLKPSELGELEILRTIECKTAAQGGPEAAA